MTAPPVIARHWRAAIGALVLWFGGLALYWAVTSGRLYVAGFIFSAMVGAFAALLPPDKAPDQTDR